MSSQIGVLIAIGQFIAGTTALVEHLLIKRWGKGRTFIMISLGMAFSLVPVALIPHWGTAGFDFIHGGIAMRWTVPSLK